VSQEVDLGLLPEWGKSATPKPAQTVIDIHTHLSVPASAAIAKQYFKPEMDARLKYSSPETNTYNGAMLARFADRFAEPAVKLADMEGMGIDIAALAVPPPQYYQWADLPLGLDLARMQNDHLAAVVAANPGRFVGLGTLPLQDVPSALTEFDRVIRDLGFPGVMIATSVAGRDFDLPQFAPLWDRAEELDALVILHPHGFDAAYRFGDYYLTNVGGLPLESMIALSRIILGGVLERHPGLKLLVVHGGGYLPFYFARTDHAFRHRPELRKHIDRLPSEYLHRVYFDTVVHASHAVEYLVRHFGAGQILLGSDYPYDMGVTDPVTLVAQAQGLTETERAMILGGNARKLLKLKG
jgi:aminocarboxymuconate-semialdehyde decarboxylase